MEKHAIKIAFVASSGGHLEEISRLKAIEENYNCFLVTEKSDFEVKDFCKKRYYVPMMNRRQMSFIPKFMLLFLKTWMILLKEKPDFIITTGALVAYPFCVVGKLLGIKVIYVESFARVNEPSLTGKLVYNMSDLFMVQWEDMLEKYPKSMLGGSIF
ncbi:MAG: polysaccharide biosynthesis protein [Butyrivibrio sp.]|nr:polysaccharide biosynthesis protein [Butyrivibrio sp.]